MSETLESLRDMLSAARSELLAGYEVGAASPSASPSPVACAVIGFTSEHLRGNLLVSARSDLLSAWVERMTGAPAGDGQVVDWVGELSNQLLGRIKRKLLGHGVEIALTPPSVLLGQGIFLSPREGTERLELPGGALECSMDLEVDPGFELPEATEDVGQMVEGELRLL